MDEHVGGHARKSDFASAVREYWTGNSNAGHRYSSEQWLSNYADDLLSVIPFRGTLVDVGCGSCQLTTYLAKKFDAVYGIDFSEAMLTAARERLAATGATNIILLSGTMQAFPPEINRADVILSNQVVQHISLEDLRGHLHQCLKVLAKDGVVCIANIPNRDFRRWYEKNVLVPRAGGRLGGWRQWRTLSRMKLRRYLDRDFLWDGIGNWFSQTDIAAVAGKVGFEAEFRASRHYQYRFHAILRPWTTDRSQNEEQGDVLVVKI